MEILPSLAAWGIGIAIFWLPVIAHLRDGGYSTRTQVVGAVSIAVFLMAPPVILWMIGWFCTATSGHRSEKLSEIIFQALRFYGFAVLVVGGIAYAVMWLAYCARSHV
ncbi:MAG: hypothetical protein KDA63_04530 [Planctomycetales bacterium]|nr:hypothetical protein [Planctomycetales bacterium]